jgi:signal transduction histidine kinase
LLKAVAGSRAEVARAGAAHYAGQVGETEPDEPNFAAGARRPRPTTALVEAMRPLDVEGARLLSAVSHQLRTPLTSALGYLELLSDQTLGPLTAEQERVLGTVAGSVARLSVIIDELDPGTARGPAERG